MKKILIYTCSIVFVLLSCNKMDEYYEGEFYKKIVYLLGSDDGILSRLHILEDDATTGYFSVGISGSEPLAEDITIVLEPDTAFFNKYNTTNFDLDTSKFAQLLSSDFYTIDSYETVIKAGEVFGTVPIKIQPVGLCPDSVYLLPLRIKSVSGAYEINDEKQSTLYKVRTENRYCSQEEASIYMMKGKRIEGENSTTIGATKQFFPLSKNSMRTTVGILAHEGDIDKINARSMVITIHDDMTLDLSVYRGDVLEVERLGGDEDNYYGQDLAGIEKFFIHYRYRNKGDDDNWGAWTEMQEYMLYLGD